MRTTFIKGLDDGLQFELGSAVEIICAVMEIGYAEDAITYYANMTGAELIAFLKEHAPRQEIIEQINPNNNYKITAFDW